VDVKCNCGLFQVMEKLTSESSIDILDRFVKSVVTSPDIPFKLGGHILQVNISKIKMLVDTLFISNTIHCDVYDFLPKMQINFKQF
jgi:hypothetical protein